MRPRVVELLPLFADCDNDDDEPKGALCSRSCWMSFKDKDLPVPSYLGGKIYYQICFHPKCHRNYHRGPTTLIISVRQQGSYQNGKRATGRCSRLRDSRVRWNAKMKKKTRGNWWEEGRPTNFRAPFTFASSPLSESREPAGEQVANKRTGKWKKKGSKPNLKPSPIRHFIFNSLFCSHFSFSRSPF